jgi:hypothetical protein
MKLRMPGPSFAVIVLALALAMGGVGYAAGALPTNSVGSAQLKKGAVKGPDIKDRAVSGTKVKDGSLTGADLAANSVTGAQIDESTLVLPKTPDPPAVVGKLVLLGSAFLPENSAITFGGFGFGGVTSPSGGQFLVPVGLPQGSTVTGVRVRVADGDVGSVTTFVRRVDPFIASAHVDGSSVATTGTPGPTTLTPPVPPAASASDTLLVYVALPAGNEYNIRGVEITYL